MKKTIVIGAGYAGLSAATSLAKKGYEVDLLEKHDMPGGRSRMFEAEGFRFDMGPSWYWMPDVFEKYFARFGKQVSDYYQLKRLDPAYRIYFSKENVVDVPASMDELLDLFESIEKGSGQKLTAFLKDAAYKYEVGINDLVYKPSQSIMEFADRRVLGGLVKMNLLSSFSKFVRKYFRDPKLIQLMEFPVLFLGAKPSNIPALYSLMNYADLQLGTWYPMGGMHEIIKGMESLAMEQGVDIRYNQEVERIHVKSKNAYEVVANGKALRADCVVGGADYHHVEQQLLEPDHRMYSEKYWDKRVMAPSCLIFYCGLDKRVKNLRHHNLFFDEDFDQHAREIYDHPDWPNKPLFYVSVPSVTDPSVAPEGQENMFVLIPVAPGLRNDDDTIRDRYFNLVMNRLETLTGQEIRKHIIYKRSYAHSEFINDYHAFKGNAYGLANTLKQTALLKPSMRSKKVKNLYFTGQLTVPGPGVPPSLISGQVVADQIAKNLAL